MDAFFDVAGGAFKLLGWVLAVLLTVSIACAAAYVIIWGVFWHVMGW